MPPLASSFFSPAAGRFPPFFMARAAHSSPAAAPGRGLSKRGAMWRWGGGLLAVVALGLAYGLAPPAAVPVGPRNRFLPAAEIQAHNSPASAWVIIDGSVYDVTAFLPVHPIGPGSILHHSGEDISAVFHKLHKPTTLARVTQGGKVKAIGVAEPEGQRVAGGK